MRLAILTRIGNILAAVKAKIKRNDCLCVKFSAEFDGGGVECLFFLGCRFRSYLLFHVVVFGFWLTDLSEKHQYLSSQEEYERSGHTLSSMPVNVNAEGYIELTPAVNAHL